MKSKFLKTGYGLLFALVVTFQLIAAPLALTAELTDQPIAERVTPNGECQTGLCQ
jgi:hypothetical protein